MKGENFFFFFQLDRVCQRDGPFSIPPLFPATLSIEHKKRIRGNEETRKTGSQASEAKQAGSNTVALSIIWFGSSFEFYIQRGAYVYIDAYIYTPILTQYHLLQLEYLNGKIIPRNVNSSNYKRTSTTSTIIYEN